MSGAIRLNGATSGYVELVAPDVAGDVQVTLPQGFQPSGLVPIKTQTFAGVAAVSLDDVFSSAYDNYRIVWRYTPSTTAYATMRLRAAGVDAAGATDYIWQYTAGNGASTASNWSSGTTSWQIGPNKQYISFGDTEVFSPAASGETQMIGQAYSRAGELQSWGGHHLQVAAYDGFTILCNGGTFSGTVTVYGYAKQIATPIQPPATGDPAGLALVASQSFVTASSVSVNGCFTSDYESYEMHFRLSAASANDTLYLRLRASGTDATTAYHYSWVQARVSDGNVGGGFGSNLGYFILAPLKTGGAVPAGRVTLLDPQLAARTSFFAQAMSEHSSAGEFTYSHGGRQQSTTQFDGFTIYPGSGTITGSLKVYGFTNA
jgi:hypothetical protein